MYKQLRQKNVVNVFDDLASIDVTFTKQQQQQQKTPEVNKHHPQLIDLWHANKRIFLRFKIQPFMRQS